MKTFGSNILTHLKKEPESVINLTKITNYDKKANFHGVKEIKGDIKMNICKCIFRSRTLLKLVSIIHQ